MIYSQRRGLITMFQVFNTKTNEVKLSTPDMVAADLMVWQQNELEVGVGYEPCWEVRYIQIGERGIQRVFRITVEEL
jgi:hypothetical protein